MRNNENEERCDSQPDYSATRSVTPVKNSYTAPRRPSPVESKRGADGASPMVPSNSLPRLYSYQERVEREQRFRDNQWMDQKTKDVIIQQMYSEQLVLFEASSPEEQRLYKQQKAHYLQARDMNS